LPKVLTEWFAGANGGVNPLNEDSTACGARSEEEFPPPHEE